MRGMLARLCPGSDILLLNESFSDSRPLSPSLIIALVVGCRLVLAGLEHHLPVSVSLTVSSARLWPGQAGLTELWLCDVTGLSHHE